MFYRFCRRHIRIMFNNKNIFFLIKFSKTESEDVERKMPSGQSRKSSNANTTMSDKRARSKSAAKKIIEAEQELKFLEIEHAIQMEVTEKYSHTSFLMKLGVVNK
jgi:hypothetical protein